MVADLMVAAIHVLVVVTIRVQEAANPTAHGVAAMTAEVIQDRINTSINSSTKRLLRDFSRSNFNQILNDG